MKKNTIILIGILLLAAILRFYKLGQVPNGLQQDETSLGYNAYSILKTGKDEHGIFLPQNFQAFGEYKLPGYIYALVPSIALFGFNPFAIRFPSALSGILSLICIYALTNYLFSQKWNESKQVHWEKYIPLIVTGFVAINPWHIHFSRAAFEVMLANFFLLCGIYFLLKGLEEKHIQKIGVAILFGSLSMYTYNIARLFVPLFYAGTLLLQGKYWKQFSVQSKIIAAIVSMVCLIPFVMGIITNGGANSTEGTLIFTSAKIQSQLQEIRSYFVLLPPVIQKTLFNYWTLTGWYYINNVFSHISANFYFINGSEHGNNAIGTHGQWYTFELSFVVIGLFWLWQQRKTTMSKLLIFWITLLILVSALTREAPQATRTFFLIYPISLASSIGFSVFIFRLSRVSNTYIRNTLFTIVSLFCLGSILFYFLSYYVRFPIYYAKHWRTADRDIVLYLSKEEHAYEKIIIDAHSGFVYTSLLTYAPIQPLIFQRAKWTTPDSEGFTRPISFDKYEFRPIEWEKDLKNPHTLIITNQTDIPSQAKKLITIYYPKRPIVINKGQEIYRYPIEEIGYLAVTANIPTEN